MSLDTLHENLWTLPDAAQLAAAGVRLVAAGVFGGVLGLDRQLEHKPAGMRTHMLVSVGTAAALIAGIAAGMTSADQSRVLQGVVAGIGFLGAGCIIREAPGDAHPNVRGLTTAASVWLTAAIGAMAALAPLWLTALATLLAWIILFPLGAVERFLSGQISKRRRRDP